MSDKYWHGNLDDDCWLPRYGMLAHVEKMDRGVWWFAISREKADGLGYDELYNTAENEKQVRLGSGKTARRAAECCLELLRMRAAQD